nr:NEW3 domain-containing protein [Jiangella alba]
MIITWPPNAGVLAFDAPDELRPGAAGDVTVTFVNEESATVTEVRLALAAPDGWTVTPSTPVQTGAVEPGAEFAATWRATAAAPSEPVEQATLEASVSYAGGSHQAQHAVAVAEPVRAPLQTAASTRAHFGQRGARLAILGNGVDLWTGVDHYGAVFHDGAAGPATTATVTVVHQEATDPNARAGLVFRNDLRGAGTSAGYVALVVKPENGLLLLWDADGSGTVESVLRAPMTPSPYPVHLRLVRSQTRFDGSYSVDGTTWQPIGSIDLPSAAATQDVGVLSCAHVQDRLGRPGQADAEVERLDPLVALAGAAGRVGGDAREQPTGRVARHDVRVDLALELVARAELDAVERLAVGRVRLAADGVADPGRRQQVALVAGVDEHLRDEDLAVLGPQRVDAPTGQPDVLQPVVAVHLDLCLFDP